MYQLPVCNLESIRKGRAAVKRILQDIGLHACNHKHNEDDQDRERVAWFFKHTSWDHMACGDPPPPKRRKGPPFHLRCRLCGHVAANPRALEAHAEAQHRSRLDDCLPLVCLFCPYRAHRAAMERHVAAFHPPRREPPAPQRHGQRVAPQPPGALFTRRFFVCRRCSQKSVSYAALRAHVARAHRLVAVSEVVGLTLELCRAAPPVVTPNGFAPPAPLIRPQSNAPTASAAAAAATNQMSSKNGRYVDVYFCKRCGLKEEAYALLVRHVADMHGVADPRTLVGHYLKLGGLSAGEAGRKPIPDRVLHQAGRAGASPLPISGRLVNQMSNSNPSARVLARGRPSTAAQRWKLCEACMELVPEEGFLRHRAGPCPGFRPGRRPPLQSSSSPAGQSTGGVARCGICGLTVRASQLAAHLSTQHGDVCHACRMSFPNTASLMAHVHKKHGGSLPRPTQDHGNMVAGRGAVPCTSSSAMRGRPLGPSGTISRPGPIRSGFQGPRPNEGVPGGGILKSLCLFCQERVVGLKGQLAALMEQHLNAKHNVFTLRHPARQTVSYCCTRCRGRYQDPVQPGTVAAHQRHCVGITRAQPTSSGQPVEQGFMHSNAQRSSEPPPPPVELILDPSGVAGRSYEERKRFLLRYFHKQPYPMRGELAVLAERLWLNRTEVTGLFTIKRRQCLRSVERLQTEVLLGFDMRQLAMVKHPLVFPSPSPNLVIARTRIKEEKKDEDDDDNEEGEVVIKEESRIENSGKSKDEDATENSSEVKIVPVGHGSNKVEPENIDCIELSDDSRGLTSDPDSVTFESKVDLATVSFDQQASACNSSFGVRDVAGSSSSIDCKDVKTDHEEKGDAFYNKSNTETPNPVEVKDEDAAVEEEVKVEVKEEEDDDGKQDNNEEVAFNQNLDATYDHGLALQIGASDDFEHQQHHPQDLGSEFRDDGVERDSGSSASPKQNVEANGEAIAALLEAGAGPLSPDPFEVKAQSPARGLFDLSAQLGALRPLAPPSPSSSSSSSSSSAASLSSSASASASLDQIEGSGAGSGAQ
uniref:activity-dependent neuroprotector homeobox protein-like n=1 Tax=Myxine glutinosa TaxID=7769 RepID=UPI00358EA65A